MPRTHQFRILHLAILLTVCCGVCLVVLGAVPFAWVRGPLDAISGDGSADPYTPALHQRLQLASVFSGTVIALLSGALWVGRERLEGPLALVGMALRENLTGLGHDLRELLRGEILFVSGVTVGGTALRLSHLAQPIRYDEAHSFLEYASFPWFITVSKYLEPNNHIFHNLLMNVSTTLFGEAEWALRLPACLAGIVIVPVTFLLGVAAAGRPAGRFASLLVAVSSPLVEYSTNARGYTLVTLLTLVGWLCAIRISRGNQNLLAVLGLILCAGLGLWTVPTMLLSLFMIWSWLLLEPVRQGIDATRSHSFRGRIRLVAVNVIATLSFAGILYLPALLVSDPLTVLGSTNSAISFSEYAAALGESIRLTGALFARDVPWGGVWLLAALILIGVRFAPVPTRLSIGKASASLSVCVIFVASRKMLPFARVWLFLVPLLAVLAGSGVSCLLQWRQARFERILIWVVSLGLCVVWPMGTMLLNQSVVKSNETGTLPDAEEIVSFVSEQIGENEPVITVTPGSTPVKYYWRRRGFDVLHFHWPDAQATAVVIVAQTVPQSVASVLAALELDDDYDPESAVLLKSFPTGNVSRVHHR